MTRIGRHFCGAAILFTLALVPYSHAGESAGAGWHRDLAAAWEQARDSQRPLLLYVTAQDCFYCRKMEHNTLSDAAVAHEIEQTFVAMTVDPSENPALTEKLGVQVYPTTVVIGLDGRVAGTITGYASPAELSEKLRRWQSKPISR